MLLYEVNAIRFTLLIKSKVAEIFRLCSNFACHTVKVLNVLTYLVLYKYNYKSLEVYVVIYKKIWYNAIKVKEKIKMIESLKSI